MSFPPFMTKGREWFSPHFWRTYVPHHCTENSREPGLFVWKTVCGLQKPKGLRPQIQRMPGCWARRCWWCWEQRAAQTRAPRAAATTARVPGRWLPSAWGAAEGAGDRGSCSWPSTRHIRITECLLYVNRSCECSERQGCDRKEWDGPPQVPLTGVIFFFTPFFPYTNGFMLLLKLGERLLKSNIQNCF